MLAISNYHLAIGSGVDIIRENAEQALNVSLGWDEYWNATYQQTNGLWLAAIYISSLIVSFTFLAFALAFWKSLATNQWQIAFEQYLWMGIVIILLNNNGAMLVPVVKAMRSIAIEQTQIIYEINISGVAIEEALKDILVTSDIKQQIAVEFRACEAKTGEQQLECVRQVGELAEEKISQAEQEWGALAGLRRLSDRVVQNVQDIIDDPTQMIGGLGRLTLDGPIVGTIAQAIIHQFLKLCQWGFANLFELALAMTGLYAPVAVALSAVPVPTKFLWYWLISFLSIAVAVWSYAITVGMVGWVVARSGTQTYADTGFLLLIGLFAPCLSWVLARGGGIAIWQSATSGAITILRALS
ncbi:hypothetical protein [Myxosarcina sp. GI1]|uniref:hypothetical protein n=1 Tax=Myxosarcina sp. GI1 TaxID=1541065 RepID=UPI0012E082E8|nr:hypothetical protein [Myxosarcina sp. GI1]